MTNKDPHDGAVLTEFQIEVARAFFGFEEFGTDSAGFQFGITLQVLASGSVNGRSYGGW